LLELGCQRIAGMTVRQYDGEPNVERAARSLVKPARAASQITKSLKLTTKNCF
jgi:hypothetical protein